MAKWEYKILIGDSRKVEADPNKLAEDGWEPVNLAATIGRCVVLVRRPKP